jgi:hypothetical protein
LYLSAYPFGFIPLVGNPNGDTAPEIRELRGDDHGDLHLALGSAMFPRGYATLPLSDFSSTARRRKKVSLTSLQQRLVKVTDGK